MSTKLDIYWTLFGERREWTWIDGPSAHDLKLHGGAVAVRPLPPLPFPVEYRVRESNLGNWIVESMFVVGSKGAVETFVDTEELPSSFRDALTIAKRLCRKAVAYAGR